MTVARRLPAATLLAALSAALAFSSPVFAAEDKARTVDFSAEASRPASNDLAVAQLYVEQSGADPSALAQQVNRVVAAALATARGYGDVKVQSAGTSTSPVYGKNGSKIEGWRMRSDLRLETRNVGQMSELIGKLQSSLAIAQVSMQPAPETRRKAADEATTDAIRAFEQRAGLVSSAMGKRYTIRHLNISEGGFRPPQVYARMKASSVMMDSAPAPLEGGESEVSVTINGTIELID